MPDTFLYFAYGSNMLTRRLTAPKRARSAVVVSTAFAEGWRLTFDKASSDGSGKCHIEETEDPIDRVYGVLFRIAFTEEAALDVVEGLGRGYCKDNIQVMTPDGTSKTAVAYFATQRDPKRAPYDWYKAFVVAGAVEHGLPDAYIEGLRAVPSQDDPDATRRGRNEALLSGSG